MSERSLVLVDGPGLDRDEIQVLSFQEVGTGLKQESQRWASINNEFILLGRSDWGGRVIFIFALEEQGFLIKQIFFLLSLSFF